MFHGRYATMPLYLKCKRIHRDGRDRPMGIQYVNQRWVVVTMAIPHDHENDIPSYKMTNQITLVDNPLQGT